MKDDRVLSASRFSYKKQVLGIHKYEKNFNVFHNKEGLSRGQSFSQDSF
jgi:hypothetical protein